MGSRSIRFRAPHLLLEPGRGDEVIIKDGNRAVPVKPRPKLRPKPKPTLEPLTRPPEIPPLGAMKMVRNGKVTPFPRGVKGPAALEAKVRQVIADQGAPDRIEVGVRAASVTSDELDPLIRIGHRLRIPITVHLDPNA